MLQRVKRAIPIVVYMFAHCAMAAEQTVTCPTEIPEASIRIANTPAGWQPYVASPLFLSSAGAMAGPPEKRAILMGDTTWKKGKTEWSTTYDLDGAGFAAGKWMECRYGEYDEVTLSKRLDDRTKSCTVHFSKGEKAGQRTVKIHCK
jgi:hypothetical protein